MNSSIQSVCSFCPNITLDPLGHHGVSCRHGGDVVIRHNRLRNIFAEFCHRAHLSVGVEVGQGLSRVQSNSRPAPMLGIGQNQQPSMLLLPSHSLLLLCYFA